MLPRPAARYVEAPLIGVADAFDQAWLREPLKYLVAISAVVILVNAAQAAMLGLSRLGYALAVNRQIPSFVGSLHPTRATPVGIIAFGAVTAICLLIPADLEFLAAICAFGATIAFTIVGLSVCRLRYKEPDRDRPYKMPFNVRVRGGELPIPGVLCVRHVLHGVRRAAGRARRRALDGHPLDGVRDHALRRLPHVAGQAGASSASRCPRRR